LKKGEIRGVQILAQQGGLQKKRLLAQGFFLSWLLNGNGDEKPYSPLGDGGHTGKNLVEYLSVD